MSFPVVIIAIAAIAVLVAAIVLVRRRFRARHEIFVTFPTMFGTVRIFTIEQDEQTGLHPKATAHSATSDDATLIRVMELGGAFQSATYLDERCYEPVFDYYKMYDRAFDARIPIRNTLMLGGGGYAYPKYVISHRPDVRMDVVEIDPDITLIAQRYFFLDRLIVEFETEESGRLGLVTDDARHYVEAYGATCTPATTYDAIFNDCFAGTKPVMQLATVEAAHAVKRCLAPGGVYLSNVISPLEGEGVFLHDIANTLKTTFAHVYVVPCGRFAETENDNEMVIATDGAYRFEGALELRVYPDGKILRDAEVAER